MWARHRNTFGAFPFDRFLDASPHSPLPASSSPIWTLWNGSSSSSLDFLNSSLSAWIRHPCVLCGTGELRPALATILPCPCPYWQYSLKPLLDHLGLVPPSPSHLSTSSYHLLPVGWHASVRPWTWWPSTTYPFSFFSPSGGSTSRN